MLDAVHLASLHDQSTLYWHDEAATPVDPASAFNRLVLEQHRANFDLWHREDQARDLLASDHTIAEVKHAIDRLNQHRNDLVERLDLTLLASVSPNPDAPLNSESPGLIIDRLSILSLKLFHTEEQLHRSTPEHQHRNHDRFLVLNEQRADLVACLDSLWSDVQAGRRRFKLYRQLKMYNDPTLNPVLYAQSSG